MIGSMIHILNYYPIRLFFMFTLSLSLFHCSTTLPLSDAEEAKLDRPLTRLLSGETVDKRLFDVQKKEDGTEIYAVIVRSYHAEAVRELGIDVSSVFGNVIVARASLQQLRALVDLPLIDAIQTGSTNSPQPRR